MKKSYIIIISIIAIILLIILWGVTGYNNLVGLREDVVNQFSNIDVQLERRADLIPNLVSTVKGYVKHEETVIDRVTTARERLLRADDVEDKSKANTELSKAIDALMVIVENYPDLKANENFINLQDELAGTENRIAVAKKDYNDIASKYNKKVKSIPTNILAEIFDFDDSKKDIPNVVFD